MSNELNDTLSDKDAFIISICKDESSEQTSVNREFSIKAASCLLLNLGLFEILNTDPLFLKFILSIPCFVAIIFAIRIVIPSDWKRPCDLKDVVKFEREHNTPVDELISHATDGYISSIANNWGILDRKSKFVSKMYIATLLYIAIVIFSPLCVYLVKQVLS